jgi:trigger factor
MTKITSTLAKETDGSIQITFDIPKGLIEKNEKEALGQLAKEVEVPGYRRGKAPLDKVSSQVSRERLIEKTLGKLLPTAFAGAINEYKLKPAIYPKFELVSTKDGESWQVRAVTCELPTVELGDYKKVVTSAVTSKSIWTPDKGSDKAKEGVTRDEKEQIIIKTLLDIVKVNIPKVLVDEEVNSRLASLLSRIERLGLSLESYLGSIGKTPESLREEYEKEAKNALSLDLILNKVAEDEHIEVKDNEVDKAITAASADPKAAVAFQSPQQRRIVKAILTRKAALDSLASLV